MSLEVAIVGRGKVGRALAAALSPVDHRSGRAAARPLRAEIVIFAVRDGQLPEVVQRHSGLLEAEVVLHVAGAVGPEVLAPLRPAALGQWHPVLSFVDDQVEWAGAAAVMTGEQKALRAGRRLCGALGMTPVEAPDGIDLPLYHAALALSANGMAALAASAERLLGAAGVPAPEAAMVLGPLLASVARNVGRVGASGAMSGPVRRGDAATIARHVQRLGAVAPDELSTYRASVEAQLAIARRLGDASPDALAAVRSASSDDDDAVSLEETDRGGEA